MWSRKENNGVQKKRFYNKEKVQLIIGTNNNRNICFPQDSAYNSVTVSCMEHRDADNKELAYISRLVFIPIFPLLHVSVLQKLGDTNLY